MHKVVKYVLSKALYLGVGGLFILFSSFDIYVSPTGKDINDGSLSAPKATLSAALRQAREMRRLNATEIESGINIILKAGTYNFYEPLYVRPEDSGTMESPTTICGAEGEKVILSGGVRISNWKKSGKFWVADVPDFNGRPLDFRQLWINGEKAIRARDVADFENMNRIISNDKVNQEIWVPAKAVKAIQKAPYAEMVLHQMWAVSFLRIKSVRIQGDSAAIAFHNPESRLQFERPWPQPMIGKGVNSPFYLTNAIELLDQPGEWYHDIKTHKLYYYPLEGEKIEEAIVPAIETLVQVEGTTDRPVENILFKNITFSFTTWMRPSEKGHVPLQAGMYMTEAYKLRPQMDRIDNHKLDNQGWLGRPTAAVSVLGANNINFENCHFKHLGYSGLDYISGTSKGKVENCVFSDIAGNGLVAGGFSPASQETHLPYQPTDLREVCTNLEVSDNLFSNVGNEDWGCVGIAAGYVSGFQILNNDINEVPYTAISLGWGWNRNLGCMKNNLVRGNNIYHYAKHMYDVAGIYTLGAQPGTLIAENWIHDIYHPSYVHDPHHWFYLYTDEGSSYIRVLNNRTDSVKFLQNANGPGNIWENNGPMVNDSVLKNAGRKCQNTSEFSAFEFIGNNTDKDRIIELAKANGVVDPQLYQWKNHLVLYAKMNYSVELKNKFQSLFPDIQTNIYHDPLYNFQKKYHCKDCTVATDWEHILFTANLIENTELQKEYVDYHKNQFELWPEVSAGFCNADFQQVQVFKNGRQLLLVISIPKGASLDELNPKTTENNPRVIEWNQIMKKYQTGIEGTKPDEVWVQLKEITTNK